MKARFSVSDGEVSSVRQCVSPNCNERPAGQPVSLLVLHNISLPPGHFGGGYVELFFQNQLPVAEHAYFEEISHLQVSAHLFISREGLVTQFVNLNARAWHAGLSSFEGCDNCNDFSIGIEMEGTDELPYTDKQYETLVQLTYAIEQAYPDIKRNRIVGHCDIAPGRKTDPGPAFEWSRFLAALNKVSEDC
ncbi:MAG: 1,6-anhydro-N-acetylmuramyl-L-alanine amidase AmpD [Pontibacterium sp.]